MIWDTSREAWERVRKTLNERQNAILLFIQEKGSACNLQISEGLEWPINCVTPRVLELRQMKVLIDAGKREFTDSRGLRRSAHFWRLTDFASNIRLVRNPTRAVAAKSGPAWGGATQADLLPDPMRGYL